MKTKITVMLVLPSKKCETLKFDLNNEGEESKFKSWVQIALDNQLPIQISYGEQ